MIQLSTRNMGCALVCFLSILFGSHRANAQIGAGSLTFSIDNETAMNGYTDGGTGAAIAPGTTLTGGVSVNGVTGNGGSTSVQCYANGSQIFSWSTSSNGQDTFTWKPTTAGSYTLYCAGTWEGQHANGTVDTPNIVVPVSNPSVSGYINPKYLIVGVTYAPPGASSYVQYCDNTTVSATNSITNTFSSSYQAGVKVAISAGLFGWANGTTTASSSTTYTQSSKTSNSDTVSQTTSLCTKTPGGANNYVPNNHDYDIIWLWLNPVVLLTFQQNQSGAITGTQWTGYGYSTLDQPAMDVYPVYVGWLNGDLAMTSADSKPLARAWAAGQVWPSGQGPALTSADYSKILLADPYSQCTPHPTQCPTAPNIDRYTITDNEDIPYVQPPVGGQPINETYMLGYTNSDTQSRDYTTTNSVMFGLETTYSGKAFGTGITTTFSQSNTFTTTNEVDTSLTSTNGTTATASITGPPCTVSGSQCNPAYTGATEFDVYEDNLYGTFFFNPVN